MKLRRASCLLCPRTAHSAPASHHSCSARQTGTSRRSYGSRFSQPLFASLLRMWLECMPLSRVVGAGEGVLTSVGPFETSDQAHQSTRLAASWIRENDLASALPNTPKITAGPLIAQARPAAAPTEAVLVHA